MTKTLTKAQRGALEWFARNEPVGSFPCDGSGPSLKFVRRLSKLGLVEEVGREAGMWGFTKFAMSDAGRAALADASLTERASP